jgi:hypothetical protein
MNLRDRLLVALAGLNVLLLAGLVVQSQHVYAARTDDTVRARAIELVDEHGQIRAQLNVEEGGQAVFRLRDARGEVRVKLGADTAGSGLLLLNESTEPAVHILAKNGDASLTLKDSDGQWRTIKP